MGLFMAHLGSPTGVRPVHDTCRALPVRLLAMPLAQEQCCLTRKNVGKALSSIAGRDVGGNLPGIAPVQLKVYFLRVALGRMPVEI